MTRGYQAEAQWVPLGHGQPFGVDVPNRLETTRYGVIMAAFNVVKDEVAGEEEYEWLKSNPKIMKAGKMICRLVKDIVGHEV